MTWRNVKLIFLREMRDQLRDRRTLFMVLVLPVLLYPVLGMAMVQFAVLFVEQPRLVVVRGREYLPAEPPLIRGDFFVPDLFEVPEDAELLRIVPDDGHAEQRLASGEVQVILDVPSDMRRRIENGQLFQWKPLYNSADEKSRIAYFRVKEALDNWKQQLIRERIEQRQLPPDFANPFVIEPQDIATPEQAAGGVIWAKLFPFLLVVMALTGAFYPAIDLCAGEKERGTMETLLISPAARSEIVLGKYLTICLFSMATAVTNLAAMAVTGWAVARQASPINSTSGQGPLLAPPALGGIVWIVLLLVPLAALFSALGLALAAFARSSKEGQYYLTPLFIFTMPLVLITLAPGMELNGFYSMVPVTGVALLLKALLQAQYDVALEFLVPVLLPTVLYAALALRWAVDQFRREEVLFRAAERVDLWLWLRHLVRQRQQHPSGAQAMFCYALMLLLIWFLGSALGNGHAAGGQDRRVAVQQALVVIEVAFVAAPALIMAVMLTGRPLQALLLRAAPWPHFLAAVLLAVALNPILVEANHYLQQGYPAQPRWLEEQMQVMLGGGQSIWWLLLLVAAIPAVCEELAFRGFILSGLLRRTSVPTAILASSFLFGFFHMSPHQLLNATLLGAILAVIAIRSGSLLPAVCFHLTNNALVLLLAAVSEGAGSGRAEHLQQLLFRQSGPGGTLFTPPVLIICALAATFGLTWFWRQPTRSPHCASEARPAGRAAAGDADLAETPLPDYRSDQAAELETLSSGPPHDAGT